MNQNVRTMATALASFYAVSRRVDPATGVMAMTAASWAGALLHVSPGPRNALELARRMPDDPIWKLVVAHLEDLISEERRDTQPPLAAVGGQR